MFPFDDKLNIDKYLDLIETDDYCKNADNIRKCIVFSATGNCNSLNEKVRSEMLTKHLNDYSAVTETMCIYDKNIKKVMEQTKSLNNSFQWRSNLKNIDIASKLTEITQCIPDFSNELQSFHKAFNKNIPIVKETKPRIVGKHLPFKTSHQPKVNQETSSNIFDSKCEELDEPLLKPECSVFKTARDVLNTENLKKFGNNSNNVGLKRKRRGIAGKFVSPMLSNDDLGDENSKNGDWENEVVDERLKNIDPKMVELIKSEIMDSGTKVDWTDIAGLQFAKTAIQEAVVWPMLRPDIFTGLRRPPKGILLFGPPGTGKTLIGKCVASQSKSTFFSISASSLTSKWVGDGEKMVRALFAVSRCHQPAVIFIDEIDSLLSQRSDSEHESSRRIKTEFLIQLDGATTESEEQILVIGATNRPQELDEAARRRFVKRLYIPLPELEARRQLVERLMSTERHTLSPENLMEISKLSDGYSGADMRNLCSDACLGPIRCITMSQIESIQAAEVRPVTMVDFRKSLNRVRSSVSPKDLDQYLQWDSTYGSGSF